MAGLGWTADAVGGGAAQLEAIVPALYPTLGPKFQ